MSECETHNEKWYAVCLRACVCFMSVHDSLFFSYLVGDETQDFETFFSSDILPS